MKEAKTEIWKKLKDILSKYKEELDVTADEEGKYELYGKKEVLMAHKKPQKPYFASAVVKKHHAAFYFFPIYTHPDLFVPSEGLRKTMTGKSCFTIKKDDPEIFKEIEEMTHKGFDLYRENQFV